MDFYLKNTNRFSIVGEWGIGKLNNYLIFLKVNIIIKKK